MSIASAIRWLIKARVCKKKQQTESKSLAFEKVRELIDSHIARVVTRKSHPRVFQWASLYCPIRNLDQMTIGKTYPSLISNRLHAIGDLVILILLKMRNSYYCFQLDYMFYYTIDLPQPQQYICDTINIW